ncbi:MAG: LysM peptidoglycan-binding domain-containing protein [Candidatus Moranbacteria bacterium]|nr:LysM peptidoglycan-binding domain-containing protein [Candidatus Moranbacteria bacterium]
MKKSLMAMAVVIAMGGGASALAVEVYTVQSRDTLSKIASNFSEVSWQEIAKHNGLENPNLINVGQKLEIPTKDAPGKKVVVLQPSQTSSGTFVWDNPGSNPWKGNTNAFLSQFYGSQVAQLLQREIKAENSHRALIKCGGNVVMEGETAHMIAMGFGKGIVKENVTTPSCKDDKNFSQPAKVYTAMHEGVEHRVAFPHICKNPTVITPRREEIREPTPETIVPKTSKEAVEEYRMDWEAFAGVGANYSGEKSRYAFGVAKVYPIIVKGKNGEDQFGLAIRGQGWEGEAHDKFGYEGWIKGVGPAYRYISWDGFDLGMDLTFGSRKETGHTGDRKFQQKREFNIAQLCASFNDYERRQKTGAGTWFPEIQANLCVFKPIGGIKTSASWNGQSLPEVAKALEKFSYGAYIGGRLYIYQGQYWAPFLQLGLTVEEPDLVKTLQAMIGVSFTSKNGKYKFGHIGLGWAKNLLKKGANAKFWEVGIDISGIAKATVKTSKERAMREAVKARRIQPQNRGETLYTFQPSNSGKGEIVVTATKVTGKTFEYKQLYGMERAGGGFNG